MTVKDLPNGLQEVVGQILHKGSKTVVDRTYAALRSASDADEFVQLLLSSLEDMYREVCHWHSMLLECQVKERR